MSAQVWPNPDKKRMTQLSKYLFEYLPGLTSGITAAALETRLSIWQSEKVIPRCLNEAQYSSSPIRDQNKN